MKKSHRIFWILMTAGSAASSALAVVPPPTGYTETEPNGSFARSELIPVGTTTVNGMLAAPGNFNPNLYDASAVGTLSIGNVASFLPLVGALEPRRPYTAWINNTTGVGAPDTLMRSINESFGEILRNDNSSPIGNGFASMIQGYVAGDTNVLLQVTGAGDAGFSGAHTQSGDFTLYVRYESLYDIDFLRFDNLVPGSAFQAEITLGSFNPVLGWLSDTGAINAVDDDSGDGNLSLISGIVPASGVVNLAVSGWADLQLFGYHEQAGEYSLDFRGTYVPPASTVAVFSLAGLCTARRRRN